VPLHPHIVRLRRTRQLAWKLIALSLLRQAGSALLTRAAFGAHISPAPHTHRENQP
jgi:hypothetical protein